MSENAAKKNSKKSVTTKKKVSTTKKALSKTKATATISQAQRRHMIAEAAYYIAEKRSFLPGDARNDWLEAEIQIDGHYTVKD